MYAHRQVGARPKGEPGPLILPGRSTRALVRHLVRKGRLTTNPYRRERGFRKAPEKVTAEVMDVLSLSPSGSPPAAIVAEAEDD